MRQTAAVLGVMLAATLAACGSESYEPGEEVWIDLKGDIAIHQGYALAIVIDQRKELVEIQVNALEGGEGNEYLSVLRKGRAFVPLRIVQPREEGLADVRRKRETIATYREILAQALDKPRPVSGKAARRAKRFRLHDVDLAFELHTIFVDGVLGADDEVDIHKARRQAASMLHALKARLDGATREMSDREVLAAVAAADRLTPRERARHAHAPLAHGRRLARQILNLSMTARASLTAATLAAADDLGAMVERYAEFAWRYDPQVREALRRLKTPDRVHAKAAARRFFFKDVLARLRDRTLDRVARGLSPPVSAVQIDAKFAEARSRTAEISKRLKLEVFPAALRDAFAAALKARVETLAREARLAYIRGNAHSLVLAGAWTGSLACKPGPEASGFPVAVDLRLDLDLESEGVGVFKGTLAATARATGDDPALTLIRRFLPGGRLPGEGKARAELRIRVDTETGILRWIRILDWTAGPPILRSRIDAATGHLEWTRPVRFSIDICGGRMTMIRPRKPPPSR